MKNQLEGFALRTKKVPVRMCIACREGKPKKELLRVIVADEGLRVDETGKAHGRGAYLCPDIDCLNKAMKIKAFDRSLNMSMGEQSYNAIKRVILRRGIE